MWGASSSSSSSSSRRHRRRSIVVTEVAVVGAATTTKTAATASAAIAAETTGRGIRRNRTVRRRATALATATSLMCQAQSQFVKAVLFFFQDRWSGTPLCSPRVSHAASCADPKSVCQARWAGRLSEVQGFGFSPNMSLNSSQLLHHHCMPRLAVPDGIPARCPLQVIQSYK